MSAALRRYPWAERVAVNRPHRSCHVSEKSLSKLKFSGLAAAAFLLTAGFAQAQGFNSLAGSWSGGGTINMTNGASERLRCRADYSVGGGGASAVQTLKCASDSYRVDIQSTVGLNGSAVVGTWTETTRGVSGQVNGQLNGNDLSAKIAGPGFGAGLSIGTRGSNQSISIRVDGGDVASVSLNLKKN